MQNRPVVLVTGTSSGIGRASVARLAQAGCQVMATARKRSDIKDLEGENVATEALDVTKERSMQKALDATLDRFGRIDCLVNNAGYGAYLPMEETDLDDMRAMFEVNVFGLHRLTQLVLPHLRANADRRRFGRGRIVNVASVAGHIAIPMMGSYCATKFAVRAMTTAMHGELAPWHIHACLIEPGRIKTRFGERAFAETPEFDRAGPYGHLRARWQKLNFNAVGADPDVIAKAIVHACTSRRPKFRYMAPWDAKAGSLSKRIVPDRLSNAVVRRFFRYDPNHP